MGQWFSGTPAAAELQDLPSDFIAYFENFKVKNKIIPEKTISSIELHLQKGNIRGTASAINDALKEINNAPLDIAVTGERGTGKSSFINALRGVGHEGKDAAPVGVVETTMERTPYKHPNFPSVRIWDLPGIGTTELEPKDYLEKVKFREYDFFIIVSATRFKKNDLDLAKAIKVMKKNFYFVRTKVDIDLRNAKQAKPSTFNTEKFLQQIREDCVRNMKENNIDDPQVFLISNYHVSEYDFPIMMHSLIQDISAQMHHNFMLSLPNITEAAIERKRDSLKNLIWLEAFNAGKLALVPLKLLFTEDERQKLKTSLNQYRVRLGVDDASLKTLAEDLRVPVEQLKGKIKSPTLLETKREETRWETYSRYLKDIFIYIGGPIGAGLYFMKILYLQFHLLDTVTEDAKVLLRLTYSENQLKAKPHTTSGHKTT